MSDAPGSRPTPRDESSTGPVSLKDSINELLSLLDRGLRPQSEWALLAINDAAARGLPCRWVVTLPGKPNEPMEVQLVTGKFQLVLS